MTQGDIWYEEDLLPVDDADAIQSFSDMRLSVDEARERLNNVARVRVRVQHPRWREFRAEEREFLSTGRPARYLLVRLGFEFALSEEGKQENVRFTSARCYAHLWPVHAGQPAPTIYDVAPKDLREGERRKVGIRFGPSITLENIGETSLGEIGTDLEIGMVEPGCTGYTGRDGREPYWELTPRTHSLMGIRHFWMVVEVPQQCEAFRLGVRVEAVAQGYFGVLPLRGRETVRESLPSIVIPVA